MSRAASKSAFPASRLLVCLVAALTFVITGCGGSTAGSSGGGGQNNPPPTVTIVASPASITAGNSSVLTVVITNATSVTGADGLAGTTIPLTGGTIPVSPTVTTNYTVNVVGAGGSATASATVTVTAAVQLPTVTLTANPTSIVAGSSSTLTIKASANTVSCSIAGGGLSGPVPCATPITVSPTATTTYTVTATNTAGSATASATVTVTVGAIVLNSVSPATQWGVGGFGFFTITLHGANFPTGGKVLVTPNANVLSYQVVNSTTATATLGMDANHEAARYLQAQVTQADGTGASVLVSFGVYSSDMCAVYAKTGEIFCLDTTKGWVNKFTASGAPDGPGFSVGNGRCCMTMDDLTGLLVVDATPYDQNGSEADVPDVTGFPAGTLVANSANNGMTCSLWSTGWESCVSLSGNSPATVNTAVNVAVGSNPQSIAMGVSGGTTFSYAFTVGGSAPTLWRGEVTTSGITLVNSQAIPGVTTGAPGGSAVILFDTLGTGMVASFGDNVAAVFNETSLLPVGDDISLPGVPVTLTADTADGVALFGNADVPNAGGTFTVVSPTTAAVTSVTGVEASVLPTGLVVSPAGKTFYVCSQADTCSAYSLP